MELPVISPYGHTYDRVYIVDWLARRPVDPLSLAPLAASSLCPNRALHNEIVEQLTRVATDAETTGNKHIVAAAREKLGRVEAAQSSAPAVADARVPVSKLDVVVHRCSRWANWWTLMAQETTTMLLTSLGAIFCIAVDFWGWGRSKASGPSVAQGTPVPMLSTFLKLAIYGVAPKHWNKASRATVGALRGALLLPLVPLGGSLTVGALCSLARFFQMCYEVRAAEQERAAQHPLFMRNMQIISGVVGFSSLGLFIRLCMDR